MSAIQLRPIRTYWRVCCFVCGEAVLDSDTGAYLVDGLGTERGYVCAACCTEPSRVPDVLREAAAHLRQRAELLEALAAEGTPEIVADGSLADLVVGLYTSGGGHWLMPSEQPF